MTQPLLKMATHQKLILASASPRRRELLSGLGLHFEVIPSDVDEESTKREPTELARYLAESKAAAVAEMHPDAWVLGGDTIVVFQNDMLGKPKDHGDARRMMDILSGNVHRVLGGIALVNRKESFVESCVVETRVEFQHLSRDLIEAYVNSGEGVDKAGAYAIQGIGQILVKGIEGSYTNVIGLDVSRVSRLLLEVGVAEWTF